MSATTLYGWVEAHARRIPEREAAVQGATRWTYGELQSHTHRWASAFLSAGVTKGDRVAVLARPSLDYLATFLGATAIGAIWVGLNPRYTPEELARVVRDAAPRVLALDLEHSSIVDRVALDQLSAGLPQVQVVSLGTGSPQAGVVPKQVFLRSGEGAKTGTLEHAIAAVTAEDPALLVYTSGTTGNPKGAVISHQALTICSTYQAACWAVDDMRVLNNLPINHIGCVGDITCYALACGGTIVFMEQFDPEGTLRIIQDERLTVWGQVPTMFQLALDHPARAVYDLSSLRLVLWSGAAASAALVERLLEIAPLLATSYGLTESVGSVTFTEPTRDLQRLATTVGVAAPHFEVRIVDETSADVPAGAAGELIIKGPAMFSGYWKNEAATHAAIDAAGWLHTGDLASRDADGAVRVMGRRGDRFKSGGYNIYPREIELVLETHPQIASVAVIGCTDPLYGEVGEAFIAPHEPATLNEEQLKAFCREHLANYKVPKRFHILRELPMLPIGKVDKQRLKAEAAALRTH